MGTQPPASPSTRFGPFEVDPENLELRREGVRVRIQKLPFQLLSVLLERPGHLVTRQELQKRLWPADTFVDFEDGLNTAIMKLREALGDEPENPRYVETLPRQGYRFVAKVEVRNGTGTSSEEEPSQAVPLGESESSRDWEREKAADHARSRRFIWRARALAVALFAAVAFAVWWFNPLPPPAVTQTERITTSARIDTPVRPVWDGLNVYYMERDGGHWNLMRTSLGAGSGQRINIPATNAVALDFTPGKSAILVGTFEKRGLENQLWTMPVQGGAVTRLGSVTAGAAVYSPDGTQIAYTHDSALWLMDADGSHPRKLADFPDPPAWPAWSPDGQSLRLTVGAVPDNERSSIWEISKDGANRHELLSGWWSSASKCCGSWTADGRYFIFTAIDNKDWNVWALRERGSSWRRSPRGPFRLAPGPEPLASTADASGTHLFFYDGAWQEENERLDLQTHKFSPLLPKAHVLMNSFSHDGEWLAYVDPQGGSLVRSRADGSEPVILAPGEIYHSSFPRWSPDGKWIVFGSVMSGKFANSFMVPASGGHPEPLLQQSSEVRDADWSNDGKKIVLSHALGPKDSDGRELLIVDFATRSTEKLPGSDNLVASRWSPDGRFISATVYDQSQLKLWDFSSKRWNVIGSGVAIGISVWSPDSRYLYYQDLLGAGEPLFRYDVQRKRVETVAEFSEILKAGAADRCALGGVTPDGAPFMDFNRGAYDLFTASLRLP